VNLPVAVLIWLMIIPMLLKIDIGALHQVKEHWRGIGVTLFINWAVKPFFYFNAGLAYLLNRQLGVAHCVAAPSALIGASNFFELAVATAIVLDRGGPLQKETPGTSAPGAIPILEFRNSYPRRRIPSTQKRQRPYFSSRQSCLCGHLSSPAHSLQPIISISHPKRSDQRVECEAQIAEIAGRPQRRVLVDAPLPSMFIVGIEDCPPLIIPRPAKPEQPPS
jgi:hypothetical protein